MSTSASKPRVMVVGGGLSGLAATVALAERGCTVELIEARRSLGGRAASFLDPISGEMVDHCQHVSLGCCTYLGDFCRRTGIEHQFERFRAMYFHAADGRRANFEATSWLPAPFHLGPALLTLRTLSLADRLSVALAMVRLARWRPQGQPEPTVASWLRDQRQSLTAVRHFWEPVLVSALAESLDHTALGAARKVFVESFMRHPTAYEMVVPKIPLSELYGQQLEPWFARHGVTVRLGMSVERVELVDHRAASIWLANGQQITTDYLVLAVPWRRIADLFVDSSLPADWPVLQNAARLTSSPITSVHLWFDRPIMEQPHAILVGTLSQWVFRRTVSPASGEHYYQIVISASRSLAQRPRDELTQQILAELHTIFPASCAARLLRSRVVTDPHAVFSPQPSTEALRPQAQTPLANLALAGDWIATDWPATMEGAVRSGYRAAEVILAAIGRPESCAVEELPESRWSAWLRGA